jgi:hypothetical protein
MGAAAFWIFLAVVVIMVNWKKKNQESLRHETIRFLVEKNQRLDDAQLSELLNPKPAPPPEWLVHKHGYSYRGLRATGVIFMFLAIGLSIATAWCAILLGMNHQSVLGLGIVVPLIAMTGIGLFFSARFVTPPPPDENRRDL